MCGDPNRIHLAGNCSSKNVWTMLAKWDDGTIYQQDETPSYFTNIIRTFLDNQFPAWWIGRRSPYGTWPTRSPNLTPTDFFLWGFVKDQVYRTPVRDLVDLQEIIYAAINSATPQMLRTHGSRLNASRTLMKAMLRLMELKVKLIKKLYLRN